MSLPVFLMIGLGAGVLAGLFGVGGGLIIVPALVMLGGYAQGTATGTSLVALLMPIGLAGVWAYYQAGKIDLSNIKAGLLISAGMFLGSYVGAKLAIGLPDYVLKRAFCGFLVVVAARLWWQTVPR